MSIKDTLKKTAAVVATAASLGLAGVAIAASPATAASPEPTVGIMTVGSGENNCYGEYFANRWSSTCVNATKAGFIRTRADCNGSNLYGAKSSINKGGSARGFSSGTCYPEVVVDAYAVYSAS
jgi:hypothetical protein